MPARAVQGNVACGHYSQRGFAAAAAAEVGERRALQPPPKGVSTKERRRSGPWCAPVNAGLHKNEAELGVLVLAVALEVLAHGHGLLNQVVQVLRDLRRQACTPARRHNLSLLHSLDQSGWDDAPCSDVVGPKINARRPLSL